MHAEGVIASRPASPERPIQVERRALDIGLKLYKLRTAVKVLVWIVCVFSGFAHYICSSFLLVSFSLI
jgi:hypothetical protein